MDPTRPCTCHKRVPGPIQWESQAPPIASGRENAFISVSQPNGFQTAESSPRVMSIQAEEEMLHELTDKS